MVAEKDPSTPQPFSPTSTGGKGSRTIPDSQPGQGVTPLPDGAWRTLERRLLVDRSPFARVYDDDIQLPAGQVIKNFVRVEIAPFSIMFAVRGEGDARQVAFVRQYRQAIADFTLELPAGHIEPGEDALETARRELREETGLLSDDWQGLGRYVMDANRECGFAHTFLARNVQPIGNQDHLDHGDLGEMTVLWLTLTETRQRWMAGELISAPTTLCVGLALAALETA